MFYIDPLYIVFMIPGLLIGLAATIGLRLTYAYYSRKRNLNNITGLDAANMIIQKYNLPVSVQVTGGALSENYNPSNRVVSLSNDIASTPSIAAVAITAHELGHAIQHNSNFFLIAIRTAIVPVVNIGSNLGYFLIIIGLILSFADLAWLGIIIFSLTTLFTIITLPVELDASWRGLKLIRELNLIDSSNRTGSFLVLGAAAMTYLAAVVSSLGVLLYYILRVQGISRKD